jgi:toxin ParE1/3/4
MIAETRGSLGRFRPDIGEDVRSFPVPPHLLFYRLTAETMYVARILHGRQDIGPELFGE